MKFIRPNLDLLSGIIAFLIVVVIAGLIARKANQEDMSITEYIMDKVALVVAMLLSAAALVMIVAVAVRHLLSYLFGIGEM